MKRRQSLVVRVFGPLVVLGFLGSFAFVYSLPKCSKRQSRNLSFRAEMVRLAREGLAEQSDAATRRKICDRITLEQERRGMRSAEVGCECSVNGCALGFRDRSLCEMYELYSGDETAWFVSASTSTKATTP